MIIMGIYTIGNNITINEENSVKSTVKRNFLNYFTKLTAESLFLSKIITY